MAEHSMFGPVISGKRPAVGSHPLKRIAIGSAKPPQRSKTYGENWPRLINRGGGGGKNALRSHGVHVADFRVLLVRPEFGRKFFVAAFFGAAKNFGAVASAGILSRGSSDFPFITLRE